MSEKPFIRKAQRADLERLQALYLQLSPQNTSIPPQEAKDIFERFKRYEGSEIFVGDIDDVLVSSCTLVVTPNLTKGGKPYGLIENVITDENHRGYGYGRATLDFATTHAWQQGCYKVMLLTGSKEPRTLEFYQGAGFEQTKTGFQKRRLPKRP